MVVVMFEAMKAESKVAKAKLMKSGATLFQGNAADILRDTTTSAVFPAAPVTRIIAAACGSARTSGLG